MQRFYVTALVLIASTVTSHADHCRDTFNKYMMGRIAKELPGVSRMIWEYKNAGKSEGEFVFLSRDHYMSRPVKPDRGVWVLSWNGSRYMSSNKGKSWKRISSYKKEDEIRNHASVVTTEMKAATKLVCGEEILDGIRHATFAFETLQTEPARIFSRQKHWVDIQKGYSTKTVSFVSGPGSEMTITVFWKPAQGATLPKPQ